MNRYIVDILRKWSLLVVLVLLMAGCASEFDEFETGVKVEFTTPYLQDLQIETKAPTGYSGRISGSPSMGVFVEGMQNVQSTVTYNGSSWESSLKLDPTTYNIYSYIPKRNGVTFEGNVITFTNVPFIMAEAEEILLSSGAVAETVTEAGGTFTPSDKTGSLDKYNYSIKVESKENTKNYVTFMMDRVMAKVYLNFKVHENYSKIRTIKIKEVTLKPAAGNYQSVNIACTMNDGSAIGYAMSPGSAVDHSVSFSPVNLELKDTSAKSAGVFYSVPGVQNSVVMTVTYDVYDKAETLVRADQTVTNSSIKLINTGTLERAKKYTLNVNIVPTYLYSLSDTDKESVMLVP